MVYLVGIWYPNFVRRPSVDSFSKARITEVVHCTRLRVGCGVSWLRRSLDGVQEDQRLRLQQRRRRRRRRRRGSRREKARLGAR